MAVQKCVAQEGVPHDGHYFKKRERKTCSGLTACGEPSHNQHEYDADVEYWCGGVCLCGMRSGSPHGPGAHK